MSYIVSARKWRPQTFNEIVGQQHIVRTLKNALKTNRVANAYIFSGTRGVGKTTTARILAKALNCANGPTDNPCGKCAFCVSIKNGAYVDVLEIDGASNRGIDDIRSLRDTVKYAPTNGKYKVYIIDEIHMLTREAFNALLKTLEEPPPHVVFIFATTAINKVPDTILSRCQWFDFKALRIDDMVKQLDVIARNDEITIEQDYLRMISKNAEGSMRDAQMLFDQVVSFSGKTVKEDDIRTVLGLVDKSLIEFIVEHIIKRDSRELIKLLAKARESGCNINILHKEMVEYVRNLMIIKINGDKAEGAIDIPSHEADILQQQSKKLSQDQLHRMFNILVGIDKEIKATSYSELVFEMALLRISQFDEIIPVDSVLEKIDNVERLIRGKYLKNEPLSNEPLSKRNDVNQNEEKGVKKLKTSPSGSNSNSGLQERWGVFLQEVEKQKASLPSLLENGTVLSMEEDIRIGFGKKDSFCIDRIKKSDNLKILSSAAKKVIGKELAIKIEILQDDELSESANKKKQSLSADNIGSDIISDALDIFNGSIVV